MNSEYCTATDLGKMFNLSAKKLNCVLEEMNLRDPGTKEPTFEAGGLWRVGHKTVNKIKYPIILWHRESLYQRIFEYFKNKAANDALGNS